MSSWATGTVYYAGALSHDGVYLSVGRGGAPGGYCCDDGYEDVADVGADETVDAFADESGWEVYGAGRDAC